jgi:TolA-binding protein
MLTPKKKLSKRELKEDALVKTYATVTTLYNENRRVISIAVTVFVILVIAAIIYGKNRAANNVTATTELGGVFQLFDNGQYQLAIDGVPERNIKGLKAIVDNYGNSNAGDIARFYLADAYFNLGKYQDALDQFKKFSPTGETLEISRLSGIAGCYEGMGMYRDAAEYFEKAATKDPKDATAAENLSNAVRNAIAAGEKQSAIDLLKKLKKDYPTSTYGRDVDRQLAFLTVSGGA